jgi:hypothetical protein
VHDVLGVPANRARGSSEHFHDHRESREGCQTAILTDACNRVVGGSGGGGVAAETDGGDCGCVSMAKKLLVSANPTKQSITQKDEYRCPEPT